MRYAEVSSLYVTQIVDGSSTLVVELARGQISRQKRLFWVLSTHLEHMLVIQ